MINIKVADQVAKLLATENVIIEHQPGARTASFNVDTRVLTLPIWENSTKEIYDLLICHEVGHALFTPNDVPPKDVCHSCLNVAEDVRIEKLMRQKYGGVAKVFFKGYREFVDNDFFKIKNQKIATFNLADRINLYFKIGRFVDIPFHNQKEQDILKLADEAKTFQDAIDVAKLLYEYCKQESKFGNDLEFGKGDLILDKISAIVSGAQDSSGEDEEDIAGGIGSGHTDSEDLSDRESDGEKSSKEGGSSDNDGESGQGNKGNLSEEQQNSEKEQMGSGLMGGKHGNVSVHTMDSALEELGKLIKHQYAINLHIPIDINSDNYIVSNDIVHQQITDAFASKIKYREYAELYHQFKSNAKPEVNHLVKEFETRKSADQYRRALVAKTGTLDCTKLHKYKYEEDIFNRIITHPDGKNHGLIFLLDWSSSMSGYIENTIKQMYYLVWFCKKVGIAFDVYAFSSYSVYNYLKDKPFKYNDEPKLKHLAVTDSAFSLLHFLTSRTSTNVLHKQMETLYVLASNLINPYLFHFDRISKYRLGGTPLNDALLTLPDIITKFSKKYRTQKTHCIVLTDGESASATYKDYTNGPGSSIMSKILGYRSHENFYLSNKKTGKIYSFEHPNEVTEVLVQNVRDTFPELSMIGFRLASDLSCVRQYKNLDKDYKQKIKAQWDKENSAYIKTLGYNTLFLVHTHLLNNSASFRGELQTTNDVHQFVINQNRTRKQNKKILTEFSANIS